MGEDTIALLALPVRVVYGLFFCRGEHRTEHNQFLAVPHSKELNASPEMHSLLVYRKPFDTAPGLVENNDPSTDLRGYLKQRMIV
jgi:hypothetical protein